MAHTYDELNKMSIADLRKIAEGIEHEAVHGFLTMHKEKLVPAICHALGIEAHKHHEAKGLNKTQVKMEIRALKKKRNAALTAKQSDEYRKILREIHHLKNKLRQAVK